MADLLTAFYPWTKAFHIMAVISWMAGLFYLPRLFVHHVEQAGDNADIGPVFQMMEHKLLRVIMLPAMIATWIFGLMLTFTPGVVDWGLIWPWSKAAAVVMMSWFHMWLGVRRVELASEKCKITGRQFRMMNEVPTVLMVLIVLSVVLKF